MGGVRERCDSTAVTRPGGNRTVDKGVDEVTHATQQGGNGGRLRAVATAFQQAEGDDADRYSRSSVHRRFGKGGGEAELLT